MALNCQLTRPAGSNLKLEEKAGASFGANESDNIENFIPEELVGCDPLQLKIFQVRLLSFKMSRFCEESFRGVMEVGTDSFTATVLG
ncbi:hypothetical protein AVEN_210878-1 [Araneus ventricosus]|uniref:Uncharacterized protein n=1 Tax=Araneus ventricosus TaxID=182803 RepID=A0A4Y2QV12_ARAVE|nr:hypothetical protein AVEN_43538-1 [Araneus ventricosus]GBN67183.1 hypothetical protein AVEN_210878-1 [Araneus ventricosus]